MSTNLNIRIDKDLKDKADRAFRSMGLNTSAAIILFIKQTLKREAIPFIIEADSDELTTMELLENNPKYKNVLLNAIAEDEGEAVDITGVSFDV